MGRRFLLSGALFSACLAVSAAPAAAKTHGPSHSFSNGHGKISQAFYAHALRAARMRTDATAPGPDSGLVNIDKSNFKAECTVPTPSTSSGYTNIYSRDTVISDALDFFATGNCVADLTKPQIAADTVDGHHAGQLIMVPYSHTGTQNYAEFCTNKAATLPSPKSALGYANSTTFKDGQFVETCNSIYIFI